MGAEDGAAAVMVVIADAGDPQWGDIATWVGAGGTILAFAVTFALLLMQRNEFRQIASERRELERDRRQAQARLMSAWVDGVTQAARQSAPDGHGQDVCLRYENRSDELIQDCWVTIFVRDELSGSTLDTTLEKVGLVPAGRGAATRDVPFDTEFPGTPVVELHFTDARGRFWRKTADGRLVELVGRASDPRPGEPHIAPV